jgi:3D (Asp-Asp-Asp) domain-containing protein
MLGVLLAFLPADRTADAAWCGRSMTTGYVRSDYGPHGRTFDGTSILSPEPIAAAGWSIPLGSYVEVEGLPGRYRVADRGMLGADNIDIAVWSRSEAFEITAMRSYCVYPPG